MDKYRKKPVIIEAKQFDGFIETANEIIDWSDGKVDYLAFTHKLVVHAIGGDVAADSMDWIIKGVQGEFYPCKPDIFEQTYEKLSD